MKDIIRQCGVSQGGIYRYYSDVDEILVEVINQCSPNADYRRQIDGVVESSRNPAETVEGLFSFLGRYMLENGATAGKVLFELMVLMADHPDRGRKIQSRIKDGRSGMYFMQKISQVIRSGVSCGYFHPVLPPDDIIGSISVAIDGVAVDGALLKCYGVPQHGKVPFDAARLMDTIRASALLVLNPAHPEQGGKPHA